MARAKGTGTIAKSGKNFYLRFKTLGKSIRLEGASSREEAEKIAEKYKFVHDAQNIEEITLIVARQKKIIEQKSSTPIKDVPALFAQALNKPHCGNRQLNMHISYWLDFANSLPPTCGYLEQISTQVAEQYFQNLQRPSRSWNDRLISCSLIFKTLLRTKETPFNEIRKRKHIVQLKKEFSEEQLMRIFNSIDFEYPLSVPFRDEMKVLFRIAAYTGMRLKDCALCKWESINENRINVTPCKTKMSSAAFCSIPMHRDLIEVLPERKQEGFVLPNIASLYYKDLDKIACRIIYWALEEKHEFYSELSNLKPKKPKPIKGYGMHSFRHSFASFCANSGIPIGVVTNILGVQNEFITRIYTHISDSSRNAILAALPGKNTACEQTATPNNEDKNKLCKINEILRAKKTLSNVDKKILDIIENNS